MDLLLFFVAVLPVFLIGMYIYKKDSIKESSKLLLLLFLFGILSCFPAALIGSIFGVFFPEIDQMNFIQLFIYVFLVIAFVEEMCKWFFLYKISFNHNEFDTSYDMIVYAVFVALGFACFENILYVSSTNIVTGIARGVLSVPGHACNGILMGIYLGLSKINLVNENIKLSNKFKIFSIVIPTITHGIYDFCLFVGNYLFIGIFIMFVLIIDIFCIKKIIDISKNSIRFRYKDNYCTVCGTSVRSDFCTKCGKKHI